MKQRKRQNIADKRRWFARLEEEAASTTVESSYFEVRLAQLRGLLEIDAATPIFVEKQERFTAQLVISQLERWLGSFVSFGSLGSFSAF